MKSSRHLDLIFGSSALDAHRLHVDAMATERENQWQDEAMGLRRELARAHRDFRAWRSRHRMTIAGQDCAPSLGEAVAVWLTQSASKMPWCTSCSKARSPCLRIPLTKWRFLSVGLVQRRSLNTCATCSPRRRRTSKASNPLHSTRRSICQALGLKSPGSGGSAARASRPAPPE
jgi:hypothetical protein